MKKFSRPFLYLVVVLLTAGAVLFFETPWKVKEGDVFRKRFLENLDRTAIARLEVEQLMNAVQLRRTDAGWEITEFRSKLKMELDKKERDKNTIRPQSGREGEAPWALPTEGATQAPMITPRWFPVEPDRIDMSLSALEDLTVTSLAGENPKRHSFFEVDTATGLQVRGFNEKGEKIFHLLLGKSGPDYMNSYVRVEDENKVYLSTRYLKSSFPLDVDGWRRRTIWSIQPDSIEKIVVKRKTGETTLTKEDKNWVELLNQIANLKAQYFVDDPQEKTGLQTPSATVSVITNTGVFILHLGNKTDKNTYYAQTAGDPQVYILRESFTDALEKNF
ncbi:MAG: DUF4340 domain-containing protein [Deltaproteobacteria bacterium]|nr:DUF4340 domain-containing protein [Deltaproteobacteria bacterium]